MTNPTQRPLRPALMLLLATAGWGLGFPLMKAVGLVQQQLVPGANEWLLTAQSTAVRFGLASVVLALLFWRRLRPISRLEWKFGIGLGLWTGGGMFFQMAGLGHTLASTSAFLTEMYVLIIPVTLAVWRRRWPSWALAGSCALVLAGLSVLGRVNWRHFQLGEGEWLTLLCAVIFTGAILWLDRAEFATVNKFNGTVIMFATVAGMFLPVILWTPANAGLLATIYRAPAIWGMQAGLVCVCTVLPFTLMNLWQPHLAPTHAALIYSAEPIFASGYALLVPAWLARLGHVSYANETLTASLWIGGGLITLANVLVQFDR